MTIKEEMRTPAAACRVGPVNACGGGAAVGKLSAPPRPDLPCDPCFNERVAVWNGDVSTLEVDAIVRWSDDVAHEECVARPMAHDAHGLAVDNYAVSVSPRCRFVLLSARTHAHTDPALLHRCYRNIFNKAQELGVCSLAICSIETRRIPATDVATQALMCCLGQALLQCPRLSVVLTSATVNKMRSLPPCTCRNSIRYYPAYNVNNNAAQREVDRRIRIIHNPHSNTDSAEDDTSLYGDANGAAEAAAALSFSLDTQRLLGSDPSPIPIRDANEVLEYEKLLYRAHHEDLSEISGIGCLYQSGVDRLGRPVVVFIGKWFPIGDIDLDKALLYLIKLLDPIVRGDYVIAYFHTLASGANHPPFSWLKQVYTVLPYKYKKNLKAFYIVHPTFWTKMMTWWFLTFMAPAIKHKVQSLPGVEHLYSAMPRHQLEVPAFVTEYDMTINGLHYFQPETENT